MPHSPVAVLVFFFLREYFNKNYSGFSLHLNVDFLFISQRVKERRSDWQSPILHFHARRKRANISSCQTQGRERTQLKMRKQERAQRLGNRLTEAEK
mmetsp:Transcript_30041/g.58975  ORF Transcript_30041/g.58975 Transcript_30041/m.58975 type:complete len:97 (+) Transcript_30041:555-845(+)